MRALIIAVSGDLETTDLSSTFEEVLGPEGRARVGLHPRTGCAGWVNDCGLLFPERYPRNVIGSCVLIACGARHQPYAGPVVITGWNLQNEDRSEIRDLGSPSEAFLRQLHADVRAALSSDRPDLGARRAWEQRIRDMAKNIQAQTTPTLTIRTVRTGGEPDADRR